MSGRMAGILGVIGLMLTMIGGFAAGTPPTLDSNSAELQSWVSANSGAFSGGVPVLILGWCLLLAMMMVVVSQLVDGHQAIYARVVLSLWVVATAVAVVQASLQSVLAATVDRVSDDALLATYAAFAILDLAGMLPLGLAVLMASWAGVTAGLWGSWVRMLAVVVAGLCMVSAVGFAQFTGPFIAQGPVQSAALLGAYAWALVVAMYLARSPREAQPSVTCSDHE